MRKFFIISGIVVGIVIIAYVIYRARMSRFQGGEGNIGNPPVQIQPTEIKEYDMTKWKRGDRVYHDGKFEYSFGLRYGYDAISGPEIGAFVGNYIETQSRNDATTQGHYVTSALIDRGSFAPIWINYGVNDNVYVIGKKQ